MSSVLTFKIPDRTTGSDEEKRKGNNEILTETFFDMDLLLMNGTFSEKVWEESSYKGFNRKEMRRYLISKGMKRSHVALVTLLVTNLGSNVTKWTKANIRGVQMAEDAAKLIAEFKIQKNKSGSAGLADGEMLVTPTRIMLAFGDVVIATIAANRKQFQERVKGVLPSSLPIEYCWSGAIVFMPSSDKYLRNRQAYIVWALSFDYAVAEEKGAVLKKTNWDMKKSFAKVKQFFDIQKAEQNDNAIKEDIWTKVVINQSFGTESEAAILKGIGKDSVSIKAFLDLYKVDESEVKTVKDDKKKGKEEST